MDTLTNFMDQHLAGPMNKLANQKHLRAVRDGIVATLPLIIVGSFFLIIAFLPLPDDWALKTLISENAAKILLPYRMTMYIMSLYAVFGIGFSLAKSYDVDGLTGGIMAEVAFLLTFTPQAVAPATAVKTALESGIIAQNQFEALSATVGSDLGLVLPMANLGGGGMFVGIVAAILAVEITRLILKSNFKITMPPQVPESVSRSFEALTPTLVIILLFGSITYWFGFDWHGFIGGLVAPLISGSDTIWGVLLLVFLTDFFWVFGIHGASIVGSAARPLWLTMLEKNATAVTDGVALPYIAPEPFYQWFIYIGGAGATIGLAIAMFFWAKSAYAKSLGRTAFVPALFNINEPLIFGTPIVLNPILMIPFVAVPMINAVIAYVATALNLVPRLSINSPWTLPGPIGAFLAAGASWQAAVLNIVLIVLSTILWLPFFKMYDNQLLKEEQSGEQTVL